MRLRFDDRKKRSNEYDGECICDKKLNFESARETKMVCIYCHTWNTKRRKRSQLQCIYISICFCLFNLLGVNEVESQLVINIKNKGGEVYQEHIIANTTEDTIQVEYRNTDDSVITQFIDFKNEVQILRIILLGEEERGDQNQYESLCFVTLLNKTEFITSDAMSKLRQRNPGAIRQADEDKGNDIFEMDYLIYPKKSSVLSPHIARLCDSSTGLNSTQTFVREIDIRYLAGVKGSSYSFEVVNVNPLIDFKVKSLMPITRLPSIVTPKPVRCKELINSSENLVGRTKNESKLEMPLLWKCQCQVHICISWYPCGLKYCKGKDPPSGKTINYKCGIRTCKKCTQFRFYVRKKQNCLWDD